MRCLNSPQILNSLENKIVETIPADARHVLVVSAGDGRLARALREKTSGAAKVSVVTIQPGLVRYIDDLEAGASGPWDMNWYAAQVTKHGAFDFIVFYQLQEFWRGELYQFQKILRLAKPGASVWTSFLNAQASRMVARFLPPLRLGYSSLADSIRVQPNVDLASFMDLVARNGGTIRELWGALDKSAEQYCQNLPGKPAQWDVRGAKVNVTTFADAFLWGASVVAVEFQVRGGATSSVAPKLSFSPFSVNLLQALLLPYPDVQTNEGVLGAAQLEVDAWRLAPGGTLGPLAKFFIDQIGEVEKPKRVLLMGSGWGRDLLLLKHHFPNWDWVGYDHNHELVEIGHELTVAAGVTVKTADLDSPLPFEDRSFDLVLSLGYFSGLYEPAGRALAKELIRIAKGPIFHLEDGRGPEQGMQLKSYSLKGVYSDFGSEPSVQPILVDGSPNGMYMLKVAAPA